jgi:hypothetical protein
MTQTRGKDKWVCYILKILKTKNITNLL